MPGFDTEGSVIVGVMVALATSGAVGVSVGTIVGWDDGVVLGDTIG